MSVVRFVLDLALRHHAIRSPQQQHKTIIPPTMIATCKLRSIPKIDSDFPSVSSVSVDSFIGVDSVTSTTVGDSFGDAIVGISTTIGAISIVGLAEGAVEGFWVVGSIVGSAVGSALGILEYKTKPIYQQIISPKNKTNISITIK